MLIIGDRLYNLFNIMTISRSAIQGVYNGRVFLI